MEIPAHEIDAVAKVICRVNGEKLRVKINIGTGYNKKLVPVWHTYRDAAQEAILRGCAAYMSKGSR